MKKEKEGSKERKNSEVKEEKEEKSAEEIREKSEEEAGNEEIEEEIEEIPEEIPETPVFPEKRYEDWEPKTTLGKLVKQGNITSIEEILQHGYKIMEEEIVDFLVPDLKEEVLDIEIVQRMHGSGRRIKFRALVAVGNGRGYIGVGKGKAKEVGQAIRKAIRNAKLNIIPVALACGSWECRCEHKHSLPFKVSGKEGSVEITITPGPRGLGIVAGETVKKILTLAGIKDVWVTSFGNTRAKVNSAYATYYALKNTILTKVKTNA